MKVRTRDFGELDIKEDKIIRFEDGLPGFPNEKELVLISDEEFKDCSICWLQSVNNEETSFAVMNVYDVLPSYNPMADQDQLETIGNVEGNELQILNVVTIPEDYKKMTVNLKAPIVINNRTNKGKQVILNNDDYGIRHYVFDQLKSR